MNSEYLNSRRSAGNQNLGLWNRPVGLYVLFFSLYVAALVAFALALIYLLSFLANMREDITTAAWWGLASLLLFVIAKEIPYRNHNLRYDISVGRGKIRNWWSLRTVGLYAAEVDHLHSLMKVEIERAFGQARSDGNWQCFGSVEEAMKHSMRRKIIQLAVTDRLFLAINYEKSGNLYPSAVVVYTVLAKKERGEKILAAARTYFAQLVQSRFSIPECKLVIIDSATANLWMELQEV